MMEAQLTEQEHELLALVVLHRSVGNQKAQDLLGWDEATYAQVKSSLLAKGLMATGRGRGGSLEPVGHAAKVLGGEVQDLKAPEPVAHKPASWKVKGKKPKKASRPGPGMPPAPSGVLSTPPNTRTISSRSSSPSACAMCSTTCCWPPTPPPARWLHDHHRR